MSYHQIFTTTNHIYSKIDFVAKGSTCEVYKGYQKATGEVRALKILDIKYNKQLALALQRETDALGRLKHPNIVTFYSVEKEEFARKPVLVTEYCSGGTLSCFLREAENYNGLGDEEFLTFLQDMVCGTKHLRQNGFVHRDIKPSNILRCHINGRTVYKLTDFGTAKPLKDEEEFMSLVGTEEYLHPDIYEAVYFDQYKHTFNASADLWSLGATLYHAASGLPPFIPFGGRKNHTGMYHMLKKKQSGVISGIQKEAGGDIEWSHDLPDLAPMSVELRKLVLPMIAGLMENIPADMWSFDKLFTYAEEINKMAKILVLDTTKPAFVTLYFQKGESFDNVQKKLVEYCDFGVEDQCLFYRGLPLRDTKPSDPIEKVPMTSTTKPIVLICKYHNEETTRLHNVPEEIPEFHSNMHEGKELAVAQTLCEMAAKFVQNISISNHISRYLCKTFRDLRRHQSSLLDHRLTLLMGKKEWYFGILTVTGWDEVPSLITEEEEMESFVNIHLKVPKPSEEQISLLVIEIKKKIEICEAHANFIQQQLTTSQELEEVICSKDTCFYENRCCKILSEHLEHCKRLMESYLSNRSSRVRLTTHEKQIQYLEKKQMQTHVNNIVTHITQHCYPNDERIFELFNLYHRDYLEIDRRLSEMYEEIKNATDKIQELTGCLMGNTFDEQKKKVKRNKKRDILTKLINMQLDNTDAQKIKEESKQVNDSLALFEPLNPVELPSVDLDSISDTNISETNILDTNNS